MEKLKLAGLGDRCDLIIQEEVGGLGGVLVLPEQPWDLVHICRDPIWINPRMQCQFWGYPEKQGAFEKDLEFFVKRYHGFRQDAPK